MGTNKQTPCKGGCGKLAYGDRCRSCSFALKPISARVGPKPQRFSPDHPSVNTVGEFNASGGFSGQAGIAFPKVLPTIGPWWIGLDRETLQEEAIRQTPRMLRGICGNHRIDQQANWLTNY